MSQLILEEKPPLVELPLRLEPSSNYPDVRFYCPFCGSLDVYLNTDNSAIILSVCCLACEKKWRRKK